MFELIPSRVNINFIGPRHWFVALSALLTIGSVVLLFTKGLNYGIDFKGGAEVQLKFKSPTDVGTVRRNLEDAGLKHLSLQALGDEHLEFLAKMGVEGEGLQAIGQQIQGALAAKVGADQFEIVRTDVVGPQAGAELRKSGVLAMLYALLCIFVWVAIRYDSRYSPGAVLSLVHDGLVTVGVFVLTQKEFSLQTLAAILTIIGYSINDTIVIFDRIRETMRNHPAQDLLRNVNRAVNETLARSILTSLLTFMVTFSLYVFGTGVIRDFAFTMCIGIGIGAYSSVCIAAPLMIYMTQWQERRKARATGTTHHGAALGTRP